MTVCPTNATPSDGSSGGVADRPVADRVDWVRQAYAKGMRVGKIVAASGLSWGSVYSAVHGRPIAGDGRTLPALPLRRNTKPQAEAVRASRAHLVRRIWRTAGRQVRDIEKRIVTPGAAPDAHERDARMLAMLVKTLRELSALDAPAASARKRKTDASVDDEQHRDLDEFRRDLARRMDAIVAERKTGGPRTVDEA